MQKIIKIMNIHCYESLTTSVFTPQYEISKKDIKLNNIQYTIGILDKDNKKITIQFDSIANPNEIIFVKLEEFMNLEI